MLTSGFNWNLMKQNLIAGLKNVGYESPELEVLAGKLVNKYQEKCHDDEALGFEDVNALVKLEVNAPEDDLPKAITFAVMNAQLEAQQP